VEWRYRAIANARCLDSCRKACATRRSRNNSRSPSTLCGTTSAASSRNLAFQAGSSWFSTHSVDKQSDSSSTQIAVAQTTTWPLPPQQSHVTGWLGTHILQFPGMSLPLPPRAWPSQLLTSYLASRFWWASGRPAYRCQLSFEFKTGYGEEKALPEHFDSNSANCKDHVNNSVIGILLLPSQLQGASNKMGIP
jgi:hypothetical protein